MHSRWNSRGERAGEKSPQTGRRSLLAKSGPAGRGGGCGAGTSDAITSWGTFKVAVLPGGPGCLQRFSASSAASCHPPGLPILGTRPWRAWCLVSRCLSLALFSFLSIFFCSVFPLSLVLPLFLSLPCFFSFCPRHCLSFSLVSTFFFLPCLFSVSLFVNHLFFSLIFFSVSHFTFFLLLSVLLSIPKLQQPRDKSALHCTLGKVGAAPLRAPTEPTSSKIGEEGVHAGEDWGLPPGLVEQNPGFEVAASSHPRAWSRFSHYLGISSHCPIHLVHWGGKNGVLRPCMRAESGGLCQVPSR